MSLTARKVAFGLCFWLAVCAAQAGTLCVNAAATGANNGGCWTDAYVSLQSALAAAGSGDEIWVAAATYQPTATADRTITFALKNGVGIYGGFAGTETMRSQRNPAVNVTILSGDIGTVGVATDNSYHVVTAGAAVTASGVLDGFTITAGRADAASAPDDRGAGLLVASGSPTVAHCAFAGGFAGTRGGGTRVDGGNATFSDCTFLGNSSGLAGGAISAGAVTTLTFTRCVVRANTAADSTRGGGIDVTTNVAAIDCLVAGNSGNGVEYFQGGNALINTTVTGHPGYGVAVLSGASVITNSILWGDSTGEIFVNGGSGSIGVSYSDIQGGGFFGTGNINADPLFVNPAAQDWRLNAGSPAVDAGNNAAVPGGVTTDLAGLPRFFDDPAVVDTGAGTPPIVDMGAHERIPLSVTPPSPSPQIVCAGGSISFAVTANGSGPFTYRWRHNSSDLFDGGPISGAASMTLTIDPTATGDSGGYDVRVIDSLGQAVTSAAGSLTVNAVPAPPTAGNNGPICAGQTLQLTASTVVGATYSWTGPNAFTSAQQNPSIASATTAASGSYSVTVTVNGCTSAAAMTTATVTSTPAAPTAGNNGPICAGQTLQLTASTVSGATYSWTGPNGFASALQNPSISNATAAASGLYSVTVTVNGCTSSAATTTASVNAVPSAPTAGNNGPICAGQTLQLTASTVIGATYSWTGPNAFTSAQQSPSIASATTAASGSYSVTVTVNGCTSSAATTTASVGACSALPMALSADSAGNGVLEPGEAVVLAPSWENTTSSAIALTGTAVSFTGPAGAVYSISDANADYGTVGAGSTVSCAGTGNCYSVGVTNPATRPQFHWDASFAESVSTGDNKTWPIHIGQSFADVPTTNPFYRFVETLLHKGVTAGCGGSNFCPGANVSRQQMAVFLLVSKEGAAYTPPPCASPVFADVPCSSGFARWVNELSNRGVTAGCGGGNYCPTANVTRAQMAVFLLRTLEGMSYTPPACVTATFADVPCSSGFAPWVNELAARGITAGCGGGNYCPNNPNSRGQMAVFLTSTFGLRLYGP